MMVEVKRKKERKMTKDAPMYVYATEMVAHYYEQLGLKGKRVLTVVGSGDQVINALYYGASEVVGYDINRNALYIAELKMAAIKTLSYQEFLRFFSESKVGFEYDIYQRIYPLLSRNCRAYFDRLYREVGKTGLGTSPYFRKRNWLVDKTKRKKINAYLATATEYRKMKGILESNKPTLIVGSVLELTTNKKLIGEKFDLVNLSNIPNYLTGRSFGLTEAGAVSLFRKLKKLCPPHGALFFYSYDDSVYPNPQASRIPPISSRAFLKRLKESKSFRISQKRFPGIDSEGKFDRVTVLR
ncbi:MAG TPA: DUF3419 family protein [Candidatus Paceibacterota bacterium]